MSIFDELGIPREEIAAQRKAERQMIRAAVGPDNSRLIKQCERSRKKKDVTRANGRRGATPQTKNQSLAPKMTPGQVERRMVKCGKPTCKCSRGELHGPYYYHRTWSGEAHQRRYIKLVDVAETARACENYRQAQTRLRVGVAEYKQLLSQVRELFRSLPV